MVHKYPKSIEEAATLLDKVYPDWAAKINLNIFNMGSCSKCIIGQLYNGEFEETIQNLFDLNCNIGAVDAYIMRDNIFGCFATETNWIIEINKRLKKITVNNLNFYKSNGGYIPADEETKKTLELEEQSRDFRDLNLFDEFKFKFGGRTYKKLQGMHYYDLGDGKVFEARIPLDIKVYKVD